MGNKFQKIGCVADKYSEHCMKTYKVLAEKYGLEDATDRDGSYDAIVVLGGDGMMLKVLHKYMHTNIPIFGMNLGSIGFLLNEYKEDGLIERLEHSVRTKIHPLEMIVTDENNNTHTELAINEVSLLRETNQTARIKISIDGGVRMEALVADGILLATPAGSSAYNFAAHGPILPLRSNVLALTPICPFRPRRWRGALIPCSSKVQFDILEHGKRPVSAVADFTEYRDVKSVKIVQRQDIVINILFDKTNDFEDRVLEEQFTY